MSVLLLLLLSPGTSVQVQIEEVNIPDKKLTLSMKSARADVSAFSDIEPTRWMQGTVQSVSNFGMFVRPAGYDASGKCFLYIIQMQAPPLYLCNDY